jgi:hypothetical protein
MKTNPTPENPLIPPSLLEQVRAMAAAEHRSASEILRDAIELCQRDHRKVVELAKETPSAAPRLPHQAVARILERRRYRNLPEGMTIRDLMTLGRAGPSLSSTIPLLCAGRFMVARILMLTPSCGTCRVAD